MLIIYIGLLILVYKYLPILKNKVNYEYQKKFNITIFSKESSKRPFIAAILKMCIRDSCYSLMRSFHHFQ